MHPIWTRLVAFGLLATASFGGPVAAQDASPAARPAADDTAARLYEAVLPGERDAIAAETADCLSRYRIEATVSADGVGGGGAEDAAAGSPVAAEADEADVVGRRERPRGTLDLRFVNDTGADLDEVSPRLYPNDARHAAGGLEIRDTTLDGAPVTPELSVGDTVARLPLPSSLAPGASATVTTVFTSAVVETFDFSSTRFNIDPAAATIGLIHRHPILAGYDPARGGVLDPPSVSGDVVFADAARYDVAITAPPARSR